MTTKQNNNIPFKNRFRTRLILIDLIVLVFLIILIQLFIQHLVSSTTASIDTYNAADLYQVNIPDDEISTFKRTVVEQVNSYGETINIESETLGDNFQVKLYDTNTGFVTSGFNMESEIDSGINAYDLPVGSYFIELDDNSFIATNEDIDINFNTITRSGKNSKILIDSVDGLMHITKYSETENTDELDILIDPGHGGADTGAVSFDNTVSEKDLNLQLAKLLANDLAELGYNVGLTRDDDTNPGTCDDNISSYCSDGRVSQTYEYNAKLVLSIHHNTSGATGYEVYKSYYASDQLASLVANNLNSVSSPSTKITDQLSPGIYQQTYFDDEEPNITQDYMYMIRESGGIATNSVLDKNKANNTLPQGAQALLIEFGYLDDENDLAHITNTEVMQQEASAVANAVDQYLNPDESSLIDFTTEEISSNV